MKITKTLGKEKFDKLFFGKEIPDQYTIGSQDINTRYWVDDCRFLFVKNDEDGLVYCYVQPDISKPAVLVSKATEEKALNVYKGVKNFVASINIGSSESQKLKNGLFEMQKQTEFMKSFAQTAKKAVAAVSKEIESKKDGDAKEKKYAVQVNHIIGEGMKMDEKLKKLNEQKKFLVSQRNDLAGKLVAMKAQLEDERSYADALKGQFDKEILAILAEATLYIEQKDDAVAQLNEIYANYQALGVDYEELEKEKKMLQSENKWFAQQLGFFEKEFLRMKQANTKNRQSFEYALKEISKLQHKLAKTQVKTQERVSSLRKERNAAVDRISSLTAQLKKSENKYSTLKKKTDVEIEALLNEYMVLEQKNAKADKDLLEVIDAYILLEEQNKAIKAESAAIKFKKAEEVAADINENEAKVYRLTSDKDGESRPVYLAVGPHYNEAMRRQGKKGRAYETLYVIMGGDPTNVLDQDGNVVPIEKVLIDEKYRKALNIHGVSKIDVDKKHHAKIRYYDKKKNEKVANANYVKNAKDVDKADLKDWIDKNYGHGKVRSVAPTFKASAALKLAGIIAGAAVIAGGATFGGFKAWGGPNEIDQAKEHGRKQVTAFVNGLNEDQTLFQYAPAVDSYGSRIKYIKNVAGVKVAVDGNKISAIGSANRVFYNEAENKLVIEEHKQQDFWGKLKTYKNETIEGAAYQLGAEVVEELSRNNVPVYTTNENSTAKQPLYVYLNFAAESSDYSSRSAMVSYLKANGYSDELAEKITAAYEEGFVSGIENGLSNKVEKLIGSNDVVIPEVPPVSFADAATKAAIANKVAAKTLQGKKYTADELHVVYSDLDADGEQVLFVVANKESSVGANANKYLYKIVLGDGSNVIDSTNINQAIENSENVTENIRLDYMFKNAEKFGAAVENFYSKNAAGSVAYVSNYALTQNGTKYEVSPTLTIYNDNTKTVTEENAKYTVSVDAGKDSSVTEMCAVALLGDYGYFDAKNIYTAKPVDSAAVYSKTYNDNQKELN